MAPAVGTTLQVPPAAAIGLQLLRVAAITIQQRLRAAVIIIRLLHPAAVDTTTLRAAAAGTILRALPVADGIGRQVVRPAATIIESDSRLLDEASMSIRAIVRPPASSPVFFASE